MRKHTPTAQLGFDALLDDAATTNRHREFERSTGHLPGTLSEALPYYRALLATHHAAMLAADVGETMRLRKEAHDLAQRLNRGEPGILAEPASPSSRQRFSHLQTVRRLMPRLCAICCCFHPD